MAATAAEQKKGPLHCFPFKFIFGGGHNDGKQKVREYTVDCQDSHGLASSPLFGLDGDKPQEEGGERVHDFIFIQWL